MSIKQAIEAWEDRVKPEYPNTDPRTWRSGVSLGFVESHMKNEIDELRAAIAALRSMPQGEPVAWLHTMDNTEGFEENEPWCELTFGEENPFGVPGQDYSESYPVTSVPLFATPHTEAVRMSEAEIRCWWASENGFEDLDMCKIDDFRTMVRAVEQATAARLGVKMGDV